MAQVSPLGLAILTMLVERPMHPYEIGKLLRSRGKDVSIKIRYGSLYTVVQSLEKQRYVEADGTDRDGRRPERTVYRITPAGRAELTARLSQMLGEPAKDYPAFEAALSLAGVLPPDTVIALLTRRLGLLEAELAAGRASLAALLTEHRLPRLFLLENEFALALRAAETDFVRGLLHDLTAGTMDGMDFWRAFHEGAPADWSDRPFVRAEEALLGRDDPREATED